MNWPLVEPAPKLLVLPPAAADLAEAEAACELWEHYSRKVLDDDQRLAVHVMMAQTADGRWAAATTGREKPRQNGKGDEVEVVELWGLVQRAEAILHTVHDAVMLSTQTQQRMLGVLEGHQDLRRLVKRSWRGTGQQMIEMRNGGVIWYRTRTAKGGLGIDDVDRLVVDEAQEATQEHLAAVSPTLLANPNPQLNALGTAGKSGVSRWWWLMRRRAMAADPGSFGYVGTTAETVRLEDGRVVQEPVDVDDRGVWLAVNPAVRAGRGGGMDFLEEQLRRLTPSGFAREHLGVWDPPDDAADEKWLVIPKVSWQAAARPLPTSGAWLADPTYAIDARPDRSWAAIGAAGGHEAGVAVEVGHHREGCSWLVDAVVDLWKRKQPRILVDPKGPVGPYVEDMVAAGVELVEVSVDDYKRACGLFFDGVAEGRVVHHDQADLTATVASAVKRPLGDTWVWDRRSVDVTCLSTVTLAHWGHLQSPAPPPEWDVIFV